MTDEELLIWLRVEDTNLTDFAADRIEELIEESNRRLALARSEGVARVEQFERNEALEAKLAAIDDLMVRRIKHHQEMKDLKGSGTAQKREHYKLHALSEALGEIRKVTRGESHD